jgi:choline dehydrogenase-like flavoprotein
MAAPLTPRERAILACLQQTFAPARSDVARASQAAEIALSRLAPHRLAELRKLLGLLAGPLPALLIGRFAPFDRLAHPQRERLLLALADSPLPALRSGFQAFKRLAMFLAYATVDESGCNPLWNEISYPGPRSDRPAPGPAVRLMAQTPPVIDADVVVIGSGAGGSVAGALLARAGKRVVILEAGPSSDPATFDQMEADAMGRLYLESALCASDDLGVAMLAGSCVGGGTVVNWCTSLRLDGAVAAQWREASGGVDFDSSLAPQYDAVERHIAVQQSAIHNENNAALLRGCRAAGVHASVTPCNRAECGDGCGYCGFGCAYGKKQSTAATYLLDAVDAGASVIAHAKVERILITDGKARGVEASVAGAEGAAHRMLRVNAPVVVLAAGSLRSPGILARSGVTSPHLGRHLRLHPTTAAFGQFDHPVEMWTGPMQSVHSDAFADLDNGYGAKLEAVPAHPGLMALALPWRGRAPHAELMQRARFAAGLIVLTRDRGSGTISLDGRDDVNYRLRPYDARHMLRALAGLTDIVFAAGATRVMTLHTEPLVLERAQADAAGRRRFGEAIASQGAGANRLGVFSAHQMGTCRMHRDPRKGVVDERGAVHGLGGVHVADASIFPLASGVNPMLTIMALAHRIASYIFT